MSVLQKHHSRDSGSEESKCRVTRTIESDECVDHRLKRYAWNSVAQRSRSAWRRAVSAGEAKRGISLKSQRKARERRMQCVPVV